MTTLHLEIITPERTIFSGDATSVSLPTPDGEITVMPHHIPLLSIVAPGTITVRIDGAEQLIATTRGVIEVDGKSVQLLVDSADRAEELEEEVVELARKKAQELVHARRADAEGFADATAMLERQLSRLEVIRRHKSRAGRPHVA